MANGESVADERRAERLALQELGRHAQALQAMRKDGSRPSLEPAPGSVLAGETTGVWLLGICRTLPGPR
jgi:hypothetical protein